MAILRDEEERAEGSPDDDDFEASVAYRKAKQGMAKEEKSERNGAV